MEKEKNKNGGLIAIIIILLLIIVGMGYYIVTDKKSTNEKSTTEIKEKNNETKDSIEETSLDISSTDVKSLINLVKNMSLNDKFVYQNNTFKLSQLSDKEKIKATINYFANTNKVDACIGSSSEVKYKYNMTSFNNAYKQLFINASNITIDALKNSLEYSKDENEYYSDNFGVYIFDNNQFAIDLPCGFEGLEEEIISKKVISASKKGDYTYIKEKVAFAKLGEGTNYDYYKNYSKTGSVIETIEATEDRTPNYSLYNTYKYTFKNINGIVYLESYELEK